MKFNMIAVSTLTLLLVAFNPTFAHDQFRSGPLADDADGAQSVIAVDMNGDGDNELVYAAEYLDAVVLYEFIADTLDSTFHISEDTTISINFDTSMTPPFDTTFIVTVHPILRISYDSTIVVPFDTLISWKVAGYDTSGKVQVTGKTKRSVFLDRATPITTNARGARDVYAADINDDGIMDVLSASFWDDKIAWYEQDSEGNFTEHIITTGADGARAVCAADVNGDGALDALSASFWDDKIAWYEQNADGSFSEHVVSDSAYGATDVFAADLDGDGDIDILSASYDDDKIVWYENTPDGFISDSTHVLSETADGARAVYAADLDNDDDLDVLSASWEDNTIAWYENTGNEIYLFDTSQVITDNAIGATATFPADLDNDGDLDVLSASFWDDRIAWYWNNGDGLFNEDSTITYGASGATCVIAADINLDDNIDVISSSWLSDKITWYRNMGVHKGPKNVAVSFHDQPAKPHYRLSQNYPNPFNPTTQIEYHVVETCHVSLIVYNIMGQVVSELVNAYQPAGLHYAQFDSHNVPSGVYFYRIKMGNFQAVKKMVKVQ